MVEFRSKDEVSLERVSELSAASEFVDLDLFYYTVPVTSVSCCSRVCSREMWDREVA